MGALSADSSAYSSAASLVPPVHHSETDDPDHVQRQTESLRQLGAALQGADGDL